MDKDIKEEYSLIKKKYSLPDFKEIDSEFEISSIEKPAFLVKRICEKINERIDGFSAVFEELLQSEGSIKIMHELRYMDEEDKKEMYAMYKKLMVLNRDFLLAELSEDEQLQAGFVNKAYLIWKESKPTIAALIKKLKESWELETKNEEELGYLG